MTVTQLLDYLIDIKVAINKPVVNYSEIYMKLKPLHEIGITVEIEGQVVRKLTEEDYEGIIYNSDAQ
tara:strand:- start:1198 stop:1398 length:201 start_codon:yes stop_codon:yes gene_type:complete